MTFFDWPVLFWGIFKFTLTSAIIQSQISHIYWNSKSTQSNLPNFISINLSQHIHQACAYQLVRNISFSENFAYLLNGRSPFTLFLYSPTFYSHHLISTDDIMNTSRKVTFSHDFIKNNRQGKFLSRFNWMQPLQVKYIKGFCVNFLDFCKMFEYFCWSHQKG